MNKKKNMCWLIVPCASLVLAILFLIRLRRLDMLPDRTVLNVAEALAAGLSAGALLLILSHAFRKHRRLSLALRILATAMTALICVTSAYGLYLTETVSSTVSKVTADDGKNEVRSTVMLYVRKDSGITSVGDLEGKKIAYSDGYGRKMAEPVVTYIEKNLHVSFRMKKYSELADAIDDLMNQKADALMAESSYLEAIVEDSEIDGFWEQTENIASFRTYTDGRMEEVKPSS